MSRFSGPQGPGAMRQYRAKKRAEAEERQGLSRLAKKHSKPTKKQRQRRKKKMSSEEKLLKDIFEGSSNG